MRCLLNPSPDMPGPQDMRLHAVSCRPHVPSTRAPLLLLGDVNKNVGSRNEIFLYTHVITLIYFQHAVYTAEKIGENYIWQN